jgi:hypothetical protein
MVDQMARRAIGLLDLDIAVAPAREWTGEAGAA